jgi:hypothetical protein
MSLFLLEMSYFLLEMCLLFAEMCYFFAANKLFFEFYVADDIKKSIFYAFLHQQ